MSNIKKMILYKRTLYLSIIFFVLLALNIIFLAALLRYYFVHDVFKITLDAIDNLVTIISAIILLGFISSQLPKLRDLGDSSFYEVAYLIIIGLMGIIISYFNKSTHADMFIAPFMDMFEVLSVILILTILMSKSMFFKNLIDHKARKRDLLTCLVMFSIMGIIASSYILLVNNSYGNVRNLIVMIAGLAGGPVIGIPVGIISGFYRLLIGGPTAVPCSVATIICGVLSSAIYVINGKKFLKRMWASFLMFLFVGFEMLLVVWMCPDISIPYVQNLYPLMVFANVVGMVLFLMIIKEDRKPKVDYEELRIRELENTLDEYQDRVDQLEDDVEFLKNKIE